MLVLVLVAGQLGLTDLCVHQLLHLDNNKIVWCFRVFLGTVNILHSLLQRYSVQTYWKLHILPTHNQPLF